MIDKININTDIFVSVGPDEFEKKKEFINSKLNSIKAHFEDRIDIIFDDYVDYGFTNQSRFVIKDNLKELFSNQIKIQLLTDIFKALVQYSENNSIQFPLRFQLYNDFKSKDKNNYFVIFEMVICMLIMTSAQVEIAFNKLQNYLKERCDIINSGNYSRRLYISYLCDKNECVEFSY